MSMKTEDSAPNRVPDWMKIIVDSLDTVLDPVAQIIFSRKRYPL